MEAATAAGRRDFDHLREHSIGLPGVLFQSITHMAPAAAVAYSIYIAVPHAGPVLPLAVFLALVACLLAANSIGQLAKEMPAAGGLYIYTARSLGPRLGFFVAWLFLMFEPLVAPFLFLECGWAMTEVMSNEAGWHYSGQWWIWMLCVAAIVFLLTYRDIRLSTTAGIILGLFEIGVFAALAIWMLISNAGDLGLGAFNPAHAKEGALHESSFTGIFKGMVFAILAFIGFEAAAPLGEEAKHPRWAIPRAVVYSCLGIGLFYVLASYAWVYGAGFNNFVEQAGSSADPWRALAKVFWGTGWVLVFAAIINSIIANSNAGFNAATRVFYSMARNGLAPHALGRTHPQFKTPHVAIALNTIWAITVAVILGWKWGPLLGFFMIATEATVLVIVVYMMVMAGSIRYYLTKRRDAFNPLLHLVFPLAGIVLFAFPLWYQYHPLPAYPIRYAVWWALGWAILGVIVTLILARTRPAAIADTQRIYVEDETVPPPPESAAAAAPAG
jgi:amino acid transporter